MIYSSMATGGYNRGGGVAAPSLGTMETGNRKARRGMSRQQVTKSGLGKGPEPASASTDGGEEGLAAAVGRSVSRRSREGDVVNKEVQRSERTHHEVAALFGSKKDQQRRTSSS